GDHGNRGCRSGRVVRRRRRPSAWRRCQQNSRSEMSCAPASRAEVMSEDKRALLKQRLESGQIRVHPLTFPQRELWETSPVAVADPANHICCFVEIKGRITFKEAEMALQRVADRQEAMRISFVPGKERVLQVVRASGRASLGYRELSSTEARPDAIEELIKETYRSPFDLTQGPLYRVDMLRRAANDHILVFSIHHAIGDGVMDREHQDVVVRGPSQHVHTVERPLRKIKR